MSARSPITTHVLDIAAGKPAEGIAVTLERKSGDGFAQAGRGVTNADGRIADLMSPGTMTTGVWRITFHLADYWERTDTPGFYPEAAIVFEVRDTTQHYHVPLLLSPYGYSTYRGS